jgi:tetratricopeptide (TPR) repeat protein
MGYRSPREHPVPSALPWGVSVPATPEAAHTWFENERANTIAIITQISGPKVIHLADTIGSVLRRNGYLEAAQLGYERACALAGETGDRVTNAIALNGLGDVARFQDRYDDADQHYQQAITLAQQTGDRITHANALHGRGTVARLQGRYDDADQHFQQAITLAQQTGDRIAHANALHGQGWVAVGRGRTARARELLRESLRLFEAVGLSFAATVRAELERLG